MGGHFSTGADICNSWTLDNLEEDAHLQLRYARHIKTDKGPGHHGGVLCAIDGMKWCTLDFCGGRGDDGGPLQFKGFFQSEEAALKDDNWEVHGNTYYYPGCPTKVGHVWMYLFYSWNGKKYSFGHIKPFDGLSNCFGFRNSFTDWVQSAKPRFSPPVTGARVCATGKNNDMRRGTLGNITETYVSTSDDLCAMIRWDSGFENGYLLDKKMFNVVPNVGDKVWGPNVSGKVTGFYVSSSNDPCMMVDGVGGRGYFCDEWERDFAIIKPEDFSRRCKKQRTT